MKKKRIIIYIMALSLLLWPMQALAESGDSFQLDSSGLVTLDSFHAEKEGISSMSFSLTVEPEDAAKVEFVFEGSSAEILEYSYHAEEKKLNIYMAGTAPLFAEGAESLAVGRVVVSNESGQSVRATVGVVPDSLKYVYGSSLKGMEGVGIPENVQIGGDDVPAPTQTPVPTQTPPPADTPVPTQMPVPTQEPSGNTPVPTETPADTGQDSAPSDTAPSDSASSGTPLVVAPRPVTPTSTARPTARPQEEESDSETEDIYELTPIPLEPENASPEPDVTEEPFVPSGFGSADESSSGKGFLGEIGPVLAGLAVAAVVAGAGAAVVVVLIKKPKI